VRTEEEGRRRQEESAQLVVVPHDAGGRCEEHPAVLDVGTWPVANHVLDVVIETVRT